MQYKSLNFKTWELGKLRKMSLEMVFYCAYSYNLIMKSIWDHRGIWLNVNSHSGIHTVHGLAENRRMSNRDKMVGNAGELSLQAHACSKCPDYSSTHSQFSSFLNLMWTNCNSWETLITKHFYLQVIKYFFPKR